MLVQVAYSIADEDTYKRGSALFNKIDHSCRKIIITTDDIDYSMSTVRHLSLRNFLQMNDFEEIYVTSKLEELIQKYCPEGVENRRAIVISYVI